MLDFTTKATNESVMYPRLFFEPQSSQRATEASKVYTERLLSAD